MVDFEIGSGRHGCIAPLLGDGIFTQDGPKWEFSRKLLAPLIQRPALPELGLVEKHFQRLLSKTTSTSESSSPSEYQCVNLKDPLFELSLDLVTEFLLGDPTDWPAKRDGTNASLLAGAFANEFKTAFRWISKRERLKNFYWMVDSREFRDSCKAARNIVDEIVERAMQAINDQYTSAESYIALAPLLQDQASVGLIRDQFLNLLLAGRDTSGSMLCWIFYSLAREPELVRSLKNEITTLLGPDKTRNPSKSELNQMKQLDRFISESTSYTLNLFDL